MGVRTPPEPQAPQPPTSPPTNALSLAELEAQITELTGHLNAANYRWLRLIAESDRRGGWAGAGLYSCAHWLNFKCGLDLGAAREKVRVTRALEEVREAETNVAVEPPEAVPLTWQARRAWITTSPSRRCSSRSGVRKTFLRKRPTVRDGSNGRRMRRTMRNRWACELRKTSVLGNCPTPARRQRPLSGSLIRFFAPQGKSDFHYSLLVRVGGIVSYTTTIIGSGEGSVQY